MENFFRKNEEKLTSFSEVSKALVMAPLYDVNVFVQQAYSNEFSVFTVDVIMA